MGTARPRPTARTLTALVGALAVVASGSGPTKSKAEPKLPAMNARVLGFARDHVGEKVGNGQCTSLASEALRHAGARRFRLDRADGDFAWGRPVASFREALPGDVLQFRDAVFQGKAWVSKRRWVSWKHEYHHHTAVVAGVRDGGKLVTVLHQNVGPDDAPVAEKQVVQEGTLRTDSLRKGGKVWIYRPVAPDDPLPPDDEPAP